MYKMGDFVVIMLSDNKVVAEIMDVLSNGYAMVMYSGRVFAVPMTNIVERAWY